MRDLCYLHGFVERRGRDISTEKYVAFFMTDASAAAEEEAFSGAWSYISQAQPCSIFYYSKYERTIWRKLQAKYPQVCKAADIEALFDPTNTVDLYFDVVRSKTEWPTRQNSTFSIITRMIASPRGCCWMVYGNCNENGL